MRVERYLPAAAARLREIAGRAPVEACGILTAAGELVEIPSTATDPASSFDIGPLHDLESLHPGFAAIWHTHPEDTPPSSPDLAGCQVSDYPWIIAGPNRIWVLHPQPLPLAGRDFVYGEDDCWSLVSDWYANERRTIFPWFERPADGWWKTHGVSPYVEAAKAYGFDLPSLDERGFADIQVGDVLLMKVLGHRENHVAVYVGGGSIVHHMYGQLSRTELLDARYQRLTTNIARLQ
jgi:cell wall-associated NlpC family hydrolase